MANGKKYTEFENTMSTNMAVLLADMKAVKETLESHTKCIDTLKGFRWKTIGWASGISSMVAVLFESLRGK